MNHKMTKRANHLFEKRSLCLAIAAVWLMPAAFAADETADKKSSDSEAVRELTEVHSEIEFGIGYVSQDSFKFGKYNGLEKQGAFGVLDLDLRGRDPYDGASAKYWSLTGTDLGLDSRSLNYQQGEQGNYKLFIDYDQLPTNRSDSAKTIFNGAGGTNLTLPAGWVPSGTTAGMTQLLPSLKDVDIETERRKVGLGFAKSFADKWDFKVTYKDEVKDGIKTIGGVFGNSGGNPRAALLPEPVDYNTRQLDAVLGYADARKQFQLSYYMSLFNDKNDSLTWQNPYSAITGWDTSAGFAAGGQGRLALPPDNEFHQVSASGGYNFTTTTRVSADVAIGRMTQNQAFLPYTVNPTLAASITQPLPRSSLDGRIDTTLINLKLASRPTADFNWSASLRHDDRDNQTPRSEYVYIGGDSQTQNTAATSDRRRYNEPYSFTENQLKVDAGYKLAKRTEVSAGFQRSDTERTYSEREEAKENTYKLGVRTSLSDTLSGGLRLSRADRTGSTYVGEEPFLSSYSPGYTPTVTGGWENHPNLRKYFQADRTRDKLALFTTFAPGEKVTLGFNASYLKDDYTESELGLTASKAGQYTVDATYAASEALTLYSFYSYEDFRSDQDGNSFANATKLTDAFNPARDWFASHRDRVNTVGAGIKHTIAKNKFDIGTDYIYAASRSDVDVTTGSALTSAPLPTVSTRLNSLSLYGKYQIQKNMSLKARYRVEKYRSDDWALDGVAPNQLANVILLGEDSPDYRVHVITLSVGYRF
jgi:MtrB/PioB family decaheme-associated outer membrane protein